MFAEGEGGYGLWVIYNVKAKYSGTTMKSVCISVCGLKVWNRLNMDLQHSLNIYSTSSKRNLV